MAAYRWVYDSRHLPRNKTSSGTIRSVIEYGLAMSQADLLECLSVCLVRRPCCCCCCWLQSGAPLFCALRMIGLSILAGRLCPLLIVASRLYRNSVHSQLKVQNSSTFQQGRIQKNELGGSQFRGSGGRSPPEADDFSQLKASWGTWPPWLPLKSASAFHGLSRTLVALFKHQNCRQKTISQTRTFKI